MNHSFMGRANGSVYLATKDFIELECYLAESESRVEKCATSPTPARILNLSEHTHAAQIAVEIRYIQKSIFP